jgi:hypothetical protein
MKQLALAASAVGLLTMALAAAPPARADDYAVVQFQDGFCRIWWQSAGTPWGVGWTKIAIGLPDPFAAQAALDTAISQQLCR